MDTVTGLKIVDQAHWHSTKPGFAVGRTREYVRVACFADKARHEAGENIAADKSVLVKPRQEIREKTKIISYLCIVVRASFNEGDQCIAIPRISFGQGNRAAVTVPRSRQCSHRPAPKPADG